MNVKSGEKYIANWDIVVRLVGIIFAFSAVYYASLTIEFTHSQLLHFLTVLSILLLLVDLPRTMFYTKKKSALITQFLKAKKEDLPFSQKYLQSVWNETINFPVGISANLFITYLLVITPFLIYMKFIENFTAVMILKLTIASFMAITTAQLTYFFSWEILTRPILSLILEEADKRKEDIDISKQVIFKTTIPRKIKIGFLSITSISLLLAGTLGYTKLVEGIQAVNAGVDPALVISSFNFQIFAIAFVTLGIVFALSLLLSNSVNLPIKALTAGIDKVSKGDLNTRVEIISNDELGKLAGYFNQMIVSIKKGTEEIEKRNLELRKMDKLKNEMLANTSHELKTPIHQIKGITEQLIEDLENKGDGHADLIEDLRSIAESGEDLSNRVSEILESAKIASGEKNYNFEDFNLKSLVEISILYNKKNLALSNKKEKVKIFTDIPDDFEYVIGDQKAIDTVINNLLKNAVKFTDEGEIKVSAKIVEKKDIKDTVSPHAPDSEIRRNVLISVHDTGIGIDKEQHEVIFEQFRQADGSFSRGFGGTGLGLYMCKTIVQDHRGSIWVESEEGKGSAFNFLLPLDLTNFERRTGNERREGEDRRERTVNIAIVNKKESAEEEVELEDEYKTVQKGNGEIIFLVDDNPRNVGFVKKMLEGNGYRTLSAYSGEEALQTLRKNHEEGEEKIELLITDLMMPRITGYDLCKELRKSLEFRNLPIIMLTVMDDHKYNFYSINLGADEYVTKPFERSILLAKVSFLLKNVHSRNEVQSIMDLGKVLVSQYDLKKLLKLSINELKRLVYAEKVDIMLVHKDSLGDYLSVEVCEGIDDMTIKDERIAYGEGVAGTVWENKEPLLIKDIELDPRFNTLTRKGVYKTNSCVIAPIIYRDTLLGIVCAGDKKGGNVFTIDDLNYLTVLSGQIAVAINKIRDLEKIEDQHMTIMQKKNMEFMADTVNWVSHEVNTPAQAIMANVDILFDKNPQTIDEDKFERYLSNISDSCYRIRNICEIVKEYGEKGIKTEPISVTSLVANIMRYAQMNLFDEQEAGIKIIYDTEANQDAEIFGDLGMLELTTFNMVKNSFRSINQRKAKKEFEGKIEISHTVGNDSVSIQIEDNGVGIEKDDIDSIFNRNFSTSPDGRGIGLFLAKKVITDHGGTIQVESELNSYTRLILQLPLQRETSIA